MRNFLRSPLTWMVVAEFIVVGVLVVVAWTAVTAATRPALASPINQLPDSSSDSSALPDLPVLTPGARGPLPDRKSTRLNSSHSQISYAVFCLKKKKH